MQNFVRNDPFTYCHIRYYKVFPSGKFNLLNSKVLEHATQRAKLNLNFYSSSLEFQIYSTKLCAFFFTSQPHRRRQFAFFDDATFCRAKKILLRKSFRFWRVIFYLNQITRFHTKCKHNLLLSNQYQKAFSSLEIFPFFLPSKCYLSNDNTFDSSLR